MAAAAWRLLDLSVQEMPVWLAVTASGIYDHSKAGCEHEYHIQCSTDVSASSGSASLKNAKCPPSVHYKWPVIHA